MTTGTEGPDQLVNDTKVRRDSIEALGGDDSIQIFTSQLDHVVTVSGGDGFDTLSYSGFLWGAGPGSLYTGQGTFSPKNEVYYSGVERLVVNGTAISGPDRYGSPAPVYVRTGDTIDLLSLDSLWRAGSHPADVFVHAGGGDDQIILKIVGVFSEASGERGNDLIDLRGALEGFYRAYGDDGNDVLFGSGGLDLLDGGGGDDFLSPGAGRSEYPGLYDAALGGDGNDVIYSGAKLDPSDRIRGGAGDDRLVLQGDYGAGLVLGGATVGGIETLAILSAGDPAYSGAGTNLHDYVLTTEDSLFEAGMRPRIDAAGLQAGEDLTFDGSAETDSHLTVYGGGGDDRISTGAGDDLIVSGSGDDMLAGGGGRDILLGSVGNDIFRLDSAGDSTSASQDYIRDFSKGDLIDLSRIDAVTAAGGDQAFSFIGSAAFGGVAGELRVQNQRGPIWLVQGDTNGDGLADLDVLVVIVDQHAPTATDFIL